jgi:hypothetical protein
MNSIICGAWDFTPPNILAISHPMADTPHLPLSGGFTTGMSLDEYLKDLAKDIRNQRGDFFAYVKNSDGDEADTYTLKTWQVCHPDDGTYEAVVILYYAAVNPYLTIKKHMGEELAQQYLDKIAQRERAIASLTTIYKEQ